MRRKLFSLIILTFIFAINATLLAQIRQVQATVPGMY